MLQVTVIIPAHNKAVELPYCLEALVRQTIPKEAYEVIVVNDGSTDNTSRIAETYKSRLNLSCYATGERPVGAARTRNIGARAAQSMLLVFLDPDIIVSREFLESHLTAHTGTNSLVNLGYLYAVGISSDIWAKTSRLWRFMGFVPRNRTVMRMLWFFWLRVLRKDSSSTILNWAKSRVEDLDLSNNVRLFDQIERDQLWPDVRADLSKTTDGFTNMPAPWILVWSGNFSLCKTLFFEAGQFDEGFGQWGREDLEFGRRLVQSGATLRLDTRAKGFHQPHPRNEVAFTNSLQASNRYLLSKYPCLDVEMLVRFGMAECNSRINEVMHLLSRYERIDSDEFGSSLRRLLRHDKNGSVITIGCSLRTVADIESDCILEADIGIYNQLRTTVLPQRLYWLLGLSTPFGNKEFESVVVGSFWQGLHRDMLAPMLREACRIGDHVYLIVTDSSKKRLITLSASNTNRLLAGRLRGFRTMTVISVDSIRLLKIEPCDVIVAS